MRRGTCWRERGRGPSLLRVRWVRGRYLMCYCMYGSGLESRLSIYIRDACVYVPRYLSVAAAKQRKRHGGKVSHVESKCAALRCAAMRCSATRCSMADLPRPSTVGAPPNVAPRGPKPSSPLACLGPPPDRPESDRLTFVRPSYPDTRRSLGPRVLPRFDGARTLGWEVQAGRMYSTVSAPGDVAMLNFGGCANAIGVCAYLRGERTGQGAALGMALGNNARPARIGVS